MTSAVAIGGTGEGLAASIILDVFDVAVQTGWRQAAYAAVRLYLKATTIDPSLRSDVLDSATRHLLSVGAIDEATLREAAASIGATVADVDDLVGGGPATGHRAA